LGDGVGMQPLLVVVVSSRPRQTMAIHQVQPSRLGGLLHCSSRESSALQRHIVFAKSRCPSNEMQAIQANEFCKM